MNLNFIWKDLLTTNKVCENLFLLHPNSHPFIVTTLPPPEEEPTIPTEVDPSDQKIQSVENDTSDTRVIQASLNSSNFNNAVQIPVMIPISTGSNRTEVIQSQLPGMVSQPIRNSFYTTSIVNSFPYQSGNTMTFNTDLPTGPGPLSLTSSAPIQSLTHVYPICTPLFVGKYYSHSRL